MSEKFDLKRVLAEIQTDEAILPRKSLHMSQDQIKKVVATKKDREPKPAAPPEDKR